MWSLFEHCSYLQTHSHNSAPPRLCQSRPQSELHPIDWATYELHLSQVVEAVRAQLRIVRTNSRYLSAALSRYVKEPAYTLPDTLKVCMCVRLCTSHLFVCTALVMALLLLFSDAVFLVILF